MAALFGLFGLTLAFREVGFAQQKHQRDGQKDQNQQRQAIRGTLHETAMVGLFQLVGVGKQLFTVAEDLRTGQFGDGQFLHVALDAANGGSILFKTGIECVEFLPGIRIRSRSDAQGFTSLDQRLYGVAKGVRVLAQKEADFRVDGITQQQRTGVFRDPLGQHHQQVGRRNLSDAGTALQLERSDLLRQFEQLGILVVDGGDVLAQRDQALFHFEQERSILVGLVPDLCHRLQLRLYATWRRWHLRAFQFSTIGQSFQVGVEAVTRFADLLECDRVTQQCQARSLCQALRKHAHLTGGRNVDRVIGRLTVVAIDEDSNHQHYQHQTAAKDLELFDHRQAVQEGQQEGDRPFAHRFPGIDHGTSQKGLACRRCHSRQERGQESR
ncbi:MAG: hypothetical protein AW09_003223 [Candidatus Accumulibacter phosphatis]|uniref:Uncharacterized protein n=1 Tax=Candidatus Accumulibacter phosphatis TaxID=327160 RepID=A0A080LT35_9PROT|nr:MAG: hypothetical protein AW09_003223 [Candidatus Accumulibacter phosphatis]